MRFFSSLCCALTVVGVAAVPVQYRSSQHLNERDAQVSSSSYVETEAKALAEQLSELSASVNKDGLRLTQREQLIKIITGTPGDDVKKVLLTVLDTAPDDVVRQLGPMLRKARVPLTPGQTTTAPGATSSAKTNTTTKVTSLLEDQDEQEFDRAELRRQVNAMHTDSVHGVLTGIIANLKDDSPGAAALEKALFDGSWVQVDSQMSLNATAEATAPSPSKLQFTWVNAGPNGIYSMRWGDKGGTWGCKVTTKYSKVKVDAWNMQIVGDDFTYATSTYEPSNCLGNGRKHLPVGVAEGCVGSGQAQAHIDLRGSGWQVNSPSINFKVGGWLPSGGVTGSGQDIDFHVNGDCGYIVPTVAAASSDPETPAGITARINLQWIGGCPAAIGQFSLGYTNTYTCPVTQRFGGDCDSGFTYQCLVDGAIAYAGTYGYCPGGNDAVFKTSNGCCCSVQTSYKKPNPGDCAGGIIECSCFAGASNVTMADGTVKRIDQVAAGELVKSYDPSTGTESVSKVSVVEKRKTGGRSLYGVNGMKPFVTSEHLFIAADGYAAINPVDMENEDPSYPASEISVIRPAVTKLLGSNGRVVDVESIAEDASVAEDTPVYNLMLASGHTFYVNDLLVSDLFPRLDKFPYMFKQLHWLWRARAKQLDATMRKIMNDKMDGELAADSPVYTSLIHEQPQMKKLQQALLDAIDRTLEQFNKD